MLKGKNALITGGTKGIGFGIAAAMVHEGMHVAITGRTADTVNKAVNALNNIKKDHAIGFTSDVRNLTDLEMLADEITTKWNTIDVVIANAGVGHFASIEDMTSEQWRNTIDINLTGVFNTVKATLTALKKSKGYIITISSLAGANFFAKGTAYNASKFGLTGFTQALMLDLRPMGIKVSTIMPGSVATYFNGHEPTDKDAWKIQSEDIAEIVLNLLKMHPRALPSKVEVRPAQPPAK